MSTVIELQGERLELLPERAIHWPRRRTLIVADVHLGKAAVFRRAGFAIPRGSTAADLERMARLVQRHAAERLLVLGDLFHARLHADEPWFADVDAFRERHATLEIEVARGNHDRSAERAPAHWRLRWHAPALFEPPFVFAHDPDHADARGYVLGGHLHPVMRLRSAIDTLRLPVFWLRARSGVLPSFGEFTGGHPIEREAGQQVYAVTPEAVIEVPSRLRG